MNAGIIVPLVEAAPAVAMGLVNLAKDFVALFKKFPAGTTPEQFMAFGTAALGQAESGYDAFSMPGSGSSGSWAAP